MASLEVQDGIVMLKTRKFNGGAGREFPLKIGFVRFTVYERVNFAALVPKSSSVSDLGRGSSENDGLEVRII